MNLHWRILLPVGHFLVDCIILSQWLTSAAIHTDAQDGQTSDLRPVIFFQETVTFDLRFSPPDEIELLASGNLPAMAVASLIVPDGLVVNRDKLWDPVWFSVYEAAAFLVWLALGVLLDTGYLRAGYAMGIYLGARLAAAIAITAVAHIGWRLQVIFWLGLASYLLALGVRWISRKIRHS